MKYPCWLALFWLAGFTALPHESAFASGDKDEAPLDRTHVAIEALSRLKGIDLEAHPAVKQAVLRVLDQVRGQPAFVELVRDFNLPNQDETLVQMAIEHSHDATGVEAARLLMEHQAFDVLRAALSGSDVTNSARLVEALGNTGDKHVVPLILPLVTDTDQDAATRKASVRSLAKTQEGARELLALAKEDKLPSDLRLVAAMELNRARWSAIQAAAHELLPLPESQNAEPLPPISELAAMKGDPSRGEEVFHRESVDCHKCHQVRGQGVDFGPNLSEIGAKLAKHALYEAILDPSAGISFGYEAWDVELRDGDEIFGIVVSETAEELALKAQTGIVTRYRKNDIVRRARQTGSPMPSGLATAMSVQDLVDLVEYLASLKRK